VGAGLFIVKQRMWSEGVGRLEFGSQDFRGLIKILLVAGIAADAEPAIHRRARGDGIGLGKRDPVPEKEILPKMEPMVFAKHHPAIAAIFPHRSGLRASAKGGLGVQWGE
jgi:hypothetical protein